MLRLQNPRMRISLIIVLLAIIGFAAYLIGMNIWASRQYQAANAAIQRYDYVEAGQILQRYLARYPKDSSAILLAAQTARRRNDFDAAMRHLRSATKHGVPDDALAMEHRLLAIQGGEMADAAALVQFCKEQPTSSEAALILECLIEGSLRILELGLAKWSVDAWLQNRLDAIDQAQGLLWRGRLAEFAEDFPRARGDYEKALTLAPEHVPVQLRLAELHLRDDPRQAQPYLDRLLHHHPDNPDVRFQSARLRRMLGQPEEAARMLDALLASTPDRVAVLVERGRVALDLNQPTDAEPWLRQALSLAPEQRDVNQALADCLRQVGQLEEAQRYQRRAQEIEAHLQQRLDEMSKKSATKDKR
jgi:predicted Zn-dependent protease